jgi:hypothetical protein
MKRLVDPIPHTYATMLRLPRMSVLDTAAKYATFTNR